MKIIDTSMLAELSARAKINPRLRQNFNLHESNAEPCQRLLNAIEPGSYVRPHRHLTYPKPESFVGVRGKVALLIFDDAGNVEKVVPIGPQESAAGADLPPGVWHTVVCLEEGSVFYEAKPGPFDPRQTSDMAPWAPEEGSPEVKGYLEKLHGLVTDFG